MAAAIHARPVVWAWLIVWFVNVPIVAAQDDPIREPQPVESQPVGEPQPIAEPQTIATLAVTETAAEPKSAVRPDHLVVLRLSAGLMAAQMNRDIDRHTAARDVVLG